MHRAGLEPASSGSGGRCLIPLGYRCRTDGSARTRTRNFDSGDRRVTSYATLPLTQAGGWNRTTRRRLRPNGFAARRYYQSATPADKVKARPAPAREAARSTFMPAMSFSARFWERERRPRRISCAVCSGNPAFSAQNGWLVSLRRTRSTPARTNATSTAPLSRRRTPDRCYSLRDSSLPQIVTH